MTRDKRGPSYGLSLLIVPFVIPRAKQIGICQYGRELQLLKLAWMRYFFIKELLIKAIIRRDDIENGIQSKGGRKRDRALKDQNV